MHHFVTETCKSLLQDGALWDKGLVRHGICARSSLAMLHMTWEIKLPMTM